MTSTLPPPVSPESSVDPLPSKSGRILIVDDEPQMRRFIELGLRAGGYEDLIFCSSGSNVPSLALSERPQLIIMDIMMPGGNGLRALRALKKTPASAGIPVILTSGFNVLTLDDCAQNRADLVLSKPFTAAQLLQAVGNHLVDA